MPDFKLPPLPIEAARCGYDHQEGWYLLWQQEVDRYAAPDELFTADQMREYALATLRALGLGATDELPVKWTGADGTTHEISLDYAAQIAKWIFDTHGDVPQVDAVIAGVPACQPTEAQYQRRQGIRNLDGELEWRSWQVCTQKEAARIDGLSSWQWRKVTIPAAGVAVPQTPKEN